MSEICTMKIEPEKIVEILNNYYRNHGKNVNVRFTNNIELVGFYETEESVIRFQYDEDFYIDGIKVNKTVTITNEELISALNSFLNESNYEVESLTYEKGITCGDYFDKGKKSYFNGINVRISKMGPKLIFR